MFAKKKVSAFSVYKRRRLQSEEEEGLDISGTSVGGGQSSGTGSGDEEDGEAVRDGVESRGEVGGERKRKRKTKLKELSKKRRKAAVDSQMQVESGESVEDSEQAVKTKKKVAGKKKGIKKEKVANRQKTIRKSSGKKKKKVREAGEAAADDSGGEDGDISSEPHRASSPHHLEIQSVDGGDMALQFSVQFTQDSYQDSREAGRELFRLLINPFPVDHFFEEIWEQRPLFISRHKPTYNDGWFSMYELDDIIRNQYLEFTVNIDITSYQDGERCTHNPEGRAVPQVVWDFFQEGCSIRLLNPQTFSPGVWKLTSMLQEHFQSFVGANVYLTPAGMQGFAPHSDDIEAFVMQLDGKKRWKLYSPRESSEVLPRFSSRNLSQEELGEPILDVVLEPGDLLYFPRGTFHQAESLADVHSLHITLSTYQKYTWGDMLAKLMSAAVEKAMREEISFRQGLPLGCLNYTGNHMLDRGDPRRRGFVAKMEEYLEKLVQDHTIGLMDEVMDQVATENIHSSLPPFLSDEERGDLVEKRGSRWGDKGVENSLEFTTETEVKLIRYNAVRLVSTGSDGHMLYYNHMNTLVYQEKDPQAVPLTESDARLVRSLINCYPEYVKIEDLCSSEEAITEEMELLYTLYSHSIILVH